MIYGIWLAAPLVVWQALAHGAEREAKPFLTLFFLYTAAAMMVGLSVRFHAGSVMQSVWPLVPWGGAAVLSAALYVFGRRTGGADK